MALSVMSSSASFEEFHKLFQSSVVQCTQGNSLLYESHQGARLFHVRHFLQVRWWRSSFHQRGWTYVMTDVMHVGVVAMMNELHHAALVIETGGMSCREGWDGLFGHVLSCWLAYGIQRLTDCVFLLCGSGSVFVPSNKYVCHFCFLLE